MICFGVVANKILYINGFCDKILKKQKIQSTTL